MLFPEMFVVIVLFVQAITKWNYNEDKFYGATTKSEKHKKSHSCNEAQNWGTLIIQVYPLY